MTENSTNYKIVRVQTPEELQLAFDIRIKVFIDEQKFAIESEIDEFEPISTHWIAVINGWGSPGSDGNEVIGTIRLGKCPKTSYGKIERVAVALCHRGRQIGSHLMRVAEQYAKSEFKYPGCKLNAQADKQAFYEKVGYRRTDREPFLEDGAPHVEMLKTFESTV